MSFSSLGLTPELQRAVDDAGYTEPSPIQAKAIPACLEGRDVLAAAQTGTGKTAGFTLPILQRLSARAYTRNRPVRALILAPTRELAAQVHESVERYGQYLNPRLKSEVVFGGVKINPQIERLRDGVDVLVACPGRLLDLVGQRAVRLDQVETLVLDEADRMLDMGFLRDIKRVLALLPAKRQNLLFSATFSKEIRTLTQSILNDPVTIEVAPRNAAAESVAQAVYKVPKPAKSALLIHLIKQHEWKQVLVFTATKHMANRVTQRLEKAGISAAAIHGNKSQNARTNALAGFKSGTVEVLVATDVAARGIDISQLPNVINFELPNVPADYVHRIGRTGRAGASGQAVSLVSPDEQDQLRQIERLISKPIEVIAPEGFDPSSVVVEREPERPPRQPRGQGRRGAPQSARSGTDQRNGGNGNSGNSGNGERRRRRPSSQAQNGNR
ncbi:DEAD/DEAH box helicase [Halotalea alkalilenta]|uniref:DEAD-box ATP-dependent RNA helicase RhpA n=1 Tax=Halotalea alkalilenta TaxID=376489 RepID=A0A172YID3_9GAMM|nr:DEAD/DEAH box helicase [Halotalea alkalilenta]ANF58981.1 ATP-dependent RNA helicase RhlE [Halotalea alkalilenta]